MVESKTGVLKTLTLGELQVSEVEGGLWSSLRNVKGLGATLRLRVIQAANARARQTDAVTRPEAEITEAVVEQEESTDEFVDCEDYPGSQAVGTDDYATPGGAEEAPTLPQYLYVEEEEPSQDSTSLGAEPAMSFATSFASSFSQSQTSSKRTRSPRSPPSNSQPRKKHGSATRTRQSASRRAAASSTQASTSIGSTIPPPTLSEEYWTWSETDQKWYHVNEDGSCIWDDRE
jgi:hypothetical protein